MWRRNVRYVRREIKEHLALVEAYSSQALSDACGRYAETLVELVLTRLGLTRVGRNVKDYGNKIWMTTGHDLDFIFEDGDGQGYGVEVKNTFDYIPTEELRAKVAMCKYLGIIPLFIVRNRDAIQWEEVRAAGGRIFIFKSKIFPPGQEALVRRIWQEMRMPVVVRDEMPPGLNRGSQI